MTIDGSVREGRNHGDYDVRVRYRIVPGAAAWIIGILFMPIGLVLPLLLPLMAKNQLDTAIRNAFDELRDSL